MLTSNAKCIIMQDFLDYNNFILKHKLQFYSTPELYNNRRFYLYYDQCGEC